MEYKTVALPKILAERFRKIQPRYGYRNFSEFVIEATREKLYKLELEIEEGEPIEI